MAKQAAVNRSIQVRVLAGEPIMKHKLRHNLQQNTGTRAYNKCSCGGIGIHSGLKIRLPSGNVGSNPTRSTVYVVE